MQEAERSNTAAARWLAGLALAGLLGVALLARLFHLGERSVWLDEAYTYTRAALPAAQTISASIAKGHVPTYFLFMHYFIQLGDDEAMLRLPSAIFGVLTVAMAVVLGRVVGGLRVGLATGLLVALSPIQVRYAQEARMYTMFTLTAGMALAAVLWLIANREEAVEPLWRRAAWTRRADRGVHFVRPGWVWLAYSCGAALTLYLHNTGVFLIATCSCAALVLLAIARGRRWYVAGNWFAANLLVLFFWSFWLANLLTQTKKVMTRFWPDFPTRRAIWLNLKDMYLYDLWHYPWVNWFLGVLCVLGIVALRKRASLTVALLILGLLPPLLVLLVSLRTPMFMPRIMLWAPLPFFALCAAGVYAVPWPPLPLLFSAAMITAGLQTLSDYYYDYSSKPPWRDVATLIDENSPPRTRVLGARSQDATAFNYYVQRHTHPIGNRVLQVYTPQKLRKVLKNTDVVWLIDQKRGRKVSKLKSELLSMGTLERDELYGSIAVLEFRLAPPFGEAH